MRRLILMRHAKSDWSYSGLDDHARPLNARGRRSAAALGEWMRTHGYQPDTVLCSSAERTGETLLGLELSPMPPTKYLRTLYLASANTMLETLRAGSGGCILMLGHNPGICELAHRLLDEPPNYDRFFDYPTGATLVCDFDTDSWNDIGWHQGQPIDFVIPRDLI